MDSELTSTSTTTETVPLTTIFTQPTDCSTHWTYEGTYFNSWPRGILMQNVASESLDSTCFPSGWQGYGRAYTVQVFSPGACPVGYSTVTSISGDDTTTAICCYEDYTYTGLISTINFGDSSDRVFAGCTSSFPDGSVTSVSGRIQFSNGNFLKSTVVTGPVTMWAQPITIKYQFKDLAIYPALTSSTVQPSSTATSLTPVPTASPAPKVSSSSTPSPALGGPGLSSGAKAGIGIGTAAVAVALLALILFFWRSRRREKTRKKNSASNTQDLQCDVPIQSRPPDVDSGPRQPVFSHNVFVGGQSSITRNYDDIAIEMEGSMPQRHEK